MKAQCLMNNCRNAAPATEAFCSEHRAYRDKIDPHDEGIIGRTIALEDMLTAAREIIAQIEPDFRHPPAPDSIERRIERARAWLKINQGE